MTAEIPRPPEENEPPKPWDVLGIGENATQEEINKAFKEKSRGRGADLPEEEFDKIYKAFAEMGSRSAGQPEATARREKEKNKFEESLRALEILSEETWEKGKEFAKKHPKGVFGSMVAVNAALLTIIITTCASRGCGGREEGKKMPERPAVSAPDVAPAQEEFQEPAQEEPEENKPDFQEQEPEPFIKEPEPVVPVPRKAAPSVDGGQKVGKEKQELEQEKKPEQEQEEPETATIPKKLEREVVQDFKDIFGISGENVWSEGDGFFVVKRGKDYFRVGPDVFQAELGEKRNEFRQAEESAEADIHAVGKKGFRFVQQRRAQAENIKNSLRRQMVKILNNYKIPEQEVESAVEKAKEKYKKAEEERKLMEQGSERRATKAGPDWTGPEKKGYTGYISKSEEKKMQRERSTKLANQRYKI